MNTGKNHLSEVIGCFWIGLLWATIILSGCAQTIEDIPSVSTRESGEATLLWKEIPGAASYDIYVSEKPGQTKLRGVKISNVTTPFRIKNLENGKTYYFVVAVVKKSGEADESRELSYTAVKDKIGLVYFHDIVGE